MAPPGAPGPFVRLPFARRLAGSDGSIRLHHSVVRLPGGLLSVQPSTAVRVGVASLSRTLFWRHPCAGAGLVSEPGESVPDGRLQSVGAVAPARSAAVRALSL